MFRSSKKSLCRPSLGWAKLKLEPLEDRVVPVSAGDLDFTFGIAGKAVSEASRIGLVDTTVLASGKIVSLGTAGSPGSRNFYLERRLNNGQYDTTAGISGRSAVSFGGDDVATCMTVQPDGKILVAGWSKAIDGRTRFALARFNANLTLDTSFSGDGKVTTAIRNVSLSTDMANAIALASDGKIVLAGSSKTGNTNDFAVARFTAAGNLDVNFGDSGKTILAASTGDDQAYAVVIQSGKIVLGGNAQIAGRGYDFCLARLDSTGSLDTTFGTDGYTITMFGFTTDSIHSLALAPDGKIIAGGVAEVLANQQSDFAVARYTANGALDFSFNDDGTDLFDAPGQQIGKRLAVQPNGKIVLAGINFQFSPTTAMVARWNADGSDGGLYSLTKFGSLGATAQSVALQSNGRIIVAGAAGSGSGSLAFLARFHGSSSPDAVGDSFVITEDTAMILDLKANDHNEPDEAFSILSVSAPMHGTVVITGNAVTYHPALNYVGADSFTYTVRDAAGNTDTAVVHLTVTGVNDAPVNRMPTARSITRNSSTTFTGTSAFRITDVDGQFGSSFAATLSATNGILQVIPAALATVTGRGTSRLTITGRLGQINATLGNGVTFKPTAGFTGVATLTLVANDAGLSGTGGAKSDTDSVSVSVVNRAPRRAALFTQYTNYRTRRNTTLNVAATNGIRKAFLDPDNDTLTITGVTSPSRGALTLGRDGSIRYIPGLGFRGTVKFTVRVSDGIASQLAEITIIVVDS